MNRDKRLMWAVDEAKEWLGTDQALDRVVTQYRGGGNFWMATLAELDDHVDERPALSVWLQQGLGANGPWPRFFPIRWRDHYSALIVDRNGMAVLFDPQGGPMPRNRPRWYHEPPLPLLRRHLPGLELVGNHVARASQWVREDTFCVVWMTMFFCGVWTCDMVLADVYAFLVKCVRDHHRDFANYMTETRRAHRQSYTTLTRSSVQDYLHAWRRCIDEMAEEISD